MVGDAVENSQQPSMTVMCGEIEAPLHSDQIISLLQATQRPTTWLVQVVVELRPTNLPFRSIAGVSCIPIVDDGDFLMDIYYGSDITALAKDSAYAQIPLDDLNVHQVLA
ncbi:unnamed protein product [Fraxinus pennsylvanica]|uniref:Uncharacterized protein n=1 Tax=Fraxinus pennsylvanica TaxID=56036 RepID=A0AAD2DSB9_9LAMI|nr:unnamed protein product [Fraxinus pennsylvanica]